MSKVHSVPRKQGRRLAGTDFVHFGVESLFAEEATGVYERNYPFISKTGRINLSKQEPIK